MLSSSCCSVTMASRFEIVDVECIEEVKDKSENENMEKKIEYRRNIFKKWANKKKLCANLEEYQSDVLDQTLSQFYTFRNSVILASILLTNNRNGSS